LVGSRLAFCRFLSCVCHVPVPPGSHSSKVGTAMFLKKRRSHRSLALCSVLVSY
jgi:hypothetical protein